MLVRAEIMPESSVSTLPCGRFMPAVIASGEATAPAPSPSIPSTLPAMPSSTTQMANCVSPTSPTPIIFPIISSMGLQLLTITSTMRLVFSSMTLFIIMAP